MQRDHLALICAVMLLVAIVAGGCIALNYAYRDDDNVTDISAHRR